MKILVSTEKYGDTIWNLLSRNLTAFVGTFTGEAENITEYPTWYGLGVNKEGQIISNPWDFKSLQSLHKGVFYVLEDIYEVEQLLFVKCKGSIYFDQIIQLMIETLENTPIPRTDSQLEERYIDLL